MTIVTGMVSKRRKIFGWAMDDWLNSIFPLLTLLGQRGNDTPRHTPAPRIFHRIVFVDV